MTTTSRIAPRILALAASAALLTLPGCQSPNSPAGAVGDPLPAAHYPAITVPPSMQDYVVTTEERIVWTPGTETTPASVSVPIRSLSRHSAHVQYRFLWFNTQGAQIGETGWKFTTLTPQVEQQLQGNSHTGEAQAWRLEIRGAR